MSDYLPPYLFLQSYSPAIVHWLSISVGHLPVSDTQFSPPGKLRLEHYPGAFQLPATSAFTRGYIHLLLQLPRRSPGPLTCPARVSRETQNEQ